MLFRDGASKVYRKDDKMMAARGGGLLHKDGTQGLEDLMGEISEK